MIKNIIKDRTSSSSGSYKFFLDNYDDFKPIKKLTVFFEGKNFLFTPYKVDGSHVHMVLENWTGDQLHINNMNCGYGGTGPSTTSELLQHIGIDKSYADKLKFYDGLQMDFDDNGNLIKSSISTDVFFGDKIRGKYEFYLNDYTYIDLNSKKVYMINPQLSNFTGLLNLIMKMKANEIEYYIGENSPLENNFRFEEDFKCFRGKSFKYDNKIVKGVKDVNLIIRGELFDIICLVEKSYLMILINSIYMHLFKRSLFKHRILGNYMTIISSKKESFISIAFYYLSRRFNKNYKGIHNVIRFDNFNEGPIKWKYPL